MQADETKRDLLEGAAEIAEFLGKLGLKVTPRRAFHLCERGQIPAGKLGGGWIASRRAIRAHFQRLTATPPG
jgi:hypothetical protein